MSKNHVPKYAAEGAGFKEHEMDTLSLQFSLHCHFLIFGLPLGGSCFPNFERKTMTRSG